MSSATKYVVILWVVAALSADAAPLRVCADPNNLPYSNEQGQGFENKIAQLIARDLGGEVTYTWYPQREKFFKATLNSGACDVVMGVPSGFAEASTTRPYYRSTYVFLSRLDRHLEIHSLDDPRLRTLKIGVHILGEEDDSLPPVHALVSRGIVTNLVGYSIFGNLTESNPAADLIRAVQEREVDVAVVWGPLAGYFAKNSSVPLVATPINDDGQNPSLPFHFDIAIGVRAGDSKFEQALDRELIRRHAEIKQILRDYGIPELPIEPEGVASAATTTGRDQ